MCKDVKSGNKEITGEEQVNNLVEYYQKEWLFIIVVII